MKDFGKGCGVRWLGYSSDIWSNCLFDYVLGVSVKFITRNFDVVTLALGLHKKTNGYAAADLYESVQPMIQDCLNVDIYVVGTAGESDTTASAREVSLDCSIHIVSLIMLYSLRLRENTKTEKLNGKDGKYVIDGDDNARKELLEEKRLTRL